MIIKNKVKDTKTITVEDFLKLEFNNLKDSNRDTDKLRKSILKNGFVFPVYTWADHDYCIDGKGREIVVQELVKEGHSFESIPYVEIQAKDKEEAKQRVLEASSQYGNITEDSFVAFSDDMEVDFDTIEVKKNDVIQSEPDDIDFDNIESTADREVKDKDMEVVCPECGKCFNMKI